MQLKNVFHALIALIASAIFVVGTKADGVGKQLSNANFKYYASEFPQADKPVPYLVPVQNMTMFYGFKGKMVSEAQGPIHVYLNVGASNQSVFLEGSVDAPDFHAVNLAISENQHRPEIKPGQILVEGNTELLWPQGQAYSRRDIVQMGCNENGTDCITEEWRFKHFDLYNIFEATYQPKGNGHVHAGGAHLDHSLVDGYTIPMIIVPDSDMCVPVGCSEDPAGDMCPADHKIVIGQDPTYTGCASDCMLRQTDEACCRNAHNHNQCRASSRHFSNRCKGSYAYAYDDRKGLRFCREVPDVIYHFYDMDLDCDWAVMDPGTEKLSADSRKCLNRLIQDPDFQDDA